jgi:hypothetical protein
LLRDKKNVDQQQIKVGLMEQIEDRSVEKKSKQQHELDRDRAYVSKLNQNTEQQELRNKENDTITK